MFRAGVILLIIIFLQVTTMAATAAAGSGCDWKNLSPSFFKSLNSNSTIFHMCQTTADNTAEKFATISCVNDRNYLVFYANDSIYMQTSSTVRNHFLTRCWREGSVNSSCEVTMAPVKCQAWDLNNY